MVTRWRSETELREKEMNDVKTLISFASDVNGVSLCEVSAVLRWEMGLMMTERNIKTSINNRICHLLWATPVRWRRNRFWSLARFSPSWISRENAWAGRHKICLDMESLKFAEEFRIFCDHSTHNDLTLKHHRVHLPHPKTIESEKIDKTSLKIKQKFGNFLEMAQK